MDHAKLVQADNFLSMVFFKGAQPYLAILVAKLHAPKVARSPSKETKQKFDKLMTKFGRDSGPVSRYVRSNSQILSSKMPKIYRLHVISRPTGPGKT